MRAIISLFGRSPFAPLQEHMGKVSECVHMLQELFEAVQAKKHSLVDELAKKISKLEHDADLTKNDIRNHLPRSLLLPVDRSILLEILTLQDSIADSAEDVAILTTIKPVEIDDSFKEDFQSFLDKTFETFNGAQQIIHEIDELLETSFGGAEAEKVHAMVNDVAFKEHETDLLQRKLLTNLFQNNGDMHYTTFFLWIKILETLASISNLSENLAYRVRMILELKS